jgi:hypothetical protein
MSHVLHLLFFLKVKNARKMQLSAYQADTNHACSLPAKKLTGGEQRSAF